VAAKASFCLSEEIAERKKPWGAAWTGGKYVKQKNENNGW
jgi:hypothetical protein